ncbi:hypothetical protein DL546_009166 [Coniochaeta pulveracea]|uniref:F-box domain-containing protein n=1 Tax=Coniochaeta pulveracea TaxID=177199 RepID=A0A420YNS9_9PEZI|nr:hypothetical protein DL546_009166 [Coniochaeta pulveracea]
MSEMRHTLAQQSPAASITTIPTELVLMIVENLDIKDISRFSRTCRHFINLLQREMFVNASTYPHKAMRLACSTASRYGDPAAIIDRALAYGVPEDVNTVLRNPKYGYVFGTPLEHAVQVGGVSTVTHLLSLGADPNAPTVSTIHAGTNLGTALNRFQGLCTYLYIADYTEYLDQLRDSGRVVGILLDAGADATTSYSFITDPYFKKRTMYTPLPRFVHQVAHALAILDSTGSCPGHVLDEVRQLVKDIIAKLVASGASIDGIGLNELGPSPVG